MAWFRKFVQVVLALTSFTSTFINCMSRKQLFSVYLNFLINTCHILVHLIYLVLFFGLSNFLPFLSSFHCSLAFFLLYVPISITVFFSIKKLITIFLTINDASTSHTKMTLLTYHCTSGEDDRIQGKRGLSSNILIAVESWVNCLNSLSLISLICKMQVISTLWVCCKNEIRWVILLAYYKSWINGSSGSIVVILTIYYT